MKIAILVWDLNITGGTQRQALELASSLKKSGHEADIYCYSYDKENCYKELCASLPIFSVKVIEKKGTLPSKTRAESTLYRLLKRGYGLFNMYKNTVREIFVPDKRMLELKNLIEKRHPIEYYDIINIHDYEVYKIARIIRHPHIIWMMNDIKRYPLSSGGFIHKSLFNLLQRILAKKETENISKITVLDERNKMMVKQTYGKDAIVVRSGVDLDMFSGMSRDRNYRNANWTIFASSIFFPHRRFEDLVDAIEILAKRKFTNIIVVINGIPGRSYNYYLSIEKRIKDKGLEPYITIVKGMTEEELKKQYLRSDIFVFPNHNQTWGLAPIEAMLAGCAAIVSKTSGVHEVLADNETAILVNPLSPEELAGAIERLIKNPEEMKQISENGKKFVQNSLSWDKYAEQMASIFKNEI